METREFNKEKMAAEAHGPAPGRRRRAFARYLSPKESIPAGVAVAASVASFVLLVLGWAALTYTGLVDELFLPTPSSVVAALWQMTVGQGFLADVWASLYRVMVGYTLAVVLAVPLGIAMGSYAVVRAFFEPLLGVVRYLPVIAFVPLFIVWLGIGEVAKMTVIFAGTFFPLVLLVMDVSSNVQKDLLNVSYTLGASRWQTFFRVLVPASMPGVVDNMRTTLGWAWTYLLVAELLAAELGIGHVILNAQRLFDTPQILAGVLTIGILGLLSDAVFWLVYRRCFPYVRKTT